MRIIALIPALFAVLNGISQKPSYKIVYNVLHDTATSNYEVYSMDMDGKNQKNISNYSGMDWVYRTWKDKVYFISDRDTTCKRCYKLYVMDSEGNNVRKISDLVLEDSWMDVRKGGKEMLVTGRIGREIRQQLFLINLQDGSYKQLTTDTSAYYNDPVFSPSGNQIVFRHRKERRNRYAKTELYIMNSDGSGMRQLSFYPAGDSSAYSGEYFAGPPVWNRKENFISYMSYRKGRYDTYGITANGKKQWKITNTELEPGYHDWTPDGKWLVTDMSNSEGKKRYDIYLLNYKTKRLIRLTDSWKTEMAPSFVEIKK